MSRASALSGVAAAKTGIFSVWFRLDSGDANNLYFLHGMDASDQDPDISIARFSDGSIGISLGESATTQLATGALGPYVAGSEWHHLLIAWDVASSQVHVYVDDVRVTLPEPTIDATSTFSFQNCTTWHIGGFDASTDRFEGCLSEFYFAPGQYLDITNVLKRRRFILASGSPADLGSDGSLPTGTAPAIYQHLDDDEAVANFATNRGTGGDFTITGTLVTCSTSPTDGFGPFLQSLTATLAFVGSMTKLTGKATSGALSFIGALNKSTSRAITAALNFVGALNKSTSRALTATLSFVGDIAASRLVTMALAATLSFVGSLTKHTSRDMPASLSFVGSLNKQTSRALTAAASFVGNLSKRVGKTADATLSFAGNLRKHTSHVLTAALNFVGDFMGNLVGGPIVYQHSMSAALSFVGNMNKHTSRVMTAAVSFVGDMSKNSSTTMAGALSFAGSLTKRTDKVTAASLSFVGSLNKRTSRALAAAVEFVGALSGNIVASGTQYFHSMTATLSFAGALNSQLLQFTAIAIGFFRVAARPVMWVLTKVSGVERDTPVKKSEWVLSNAGPSW
jgi:hypothetical protein